MPTLQDTEISMNSNPQHTNIQTPRILRRGEELNASDDVPSTTNLLPPPPQTPPRPKSMYEGLTHEQRGDNDSAPELSRSKRRAAKNQTGKPSGSVFPIPVPNGNSLSTPGPLNFSPNRLNETPARAYAGPTFHASPAASSLPIPKFFSKSVPNVDRTSSLKGMMEQSGPKTTSESEGSPPEENRQPFGSQACEESPLDIFFRADKEARARTDNPSEDSYASNIKAHFDSSNCVPTPPSRHHSRHPTDSSTSGIFPFELDGTRSESAYRPASTEFRSASRESRSGGTNTDQNFNRISPNMPEADQREEYRKAQTAALKQLLYSPRAQVSQNNSANSRPPSSGLRKEVPLPNSPERAGAQAFFETSTPSRVHKPFTRANARTQSQQNGPSASYQPSSSSGPPRHNSESTSLRQDGEAKSIEDDLRRILKLEVLGDGLSPVRS
ncbi:hypothetical protein MMC21_004765 [Puttea exsequens]|nr:hypothetical protein [Puttea exsequens]